MRVLICAVGSIGDVAPYTGLAAGLRAAGHDVTIAGYEQYRGYVASRGLPFRPVPGSSQALFDSDQGRRWQRRGTGPVGALRGHLIHLPHARQLVQGLAAATEPGADLLLLSGSATLGHHVGEAFGIPSVGAYLTPVFPSREVPPWMAGVGRPLGGWANKSLGLAAAIGLGVLYNGVLTKVRTDLGLPPITNPAARRTVQHRIRSACFGFSPSVVPRPADWPDTAQVAGYWWPQPVPDWRPPPRLVDFLDAGPPPVYIGFGSVTRPGGGEVPVDLLRAALRQAGVRGVIHTTAGGSAGAASTDGGFVAGAASTDGADGASTDGDDVLMLSEPVPHEWLFPRTAAVVHHAAAGTTAASLRAGRPVVPVPVATDHPFWADRVHRLGVGAPPLPVRRLTAARLAHAVRTVLDDHSHTVRATVLASRVRAEDGAATAAQLIEHLARRTA